MTSNTNFDSSNSKFIPGQFKPARLVLLVLIIMLCISQAIKWYSNAVTLPRFCEDPQAALHHLDELINKQKPVGEGRLARKPYIIAAKLIYLVPQQSNESNDNYLQRLQTELSTRCVR